jgi:hypothetical protein
VPFINHHLNGYTVGEVVNSLADSGYACTFEPLPAGSVDVPIKVLTPHAQTKVYLGMLEVMFPAWDLKDIKVDVLYDKMREVFATDEGSSVPPPTSIIVPAANIAAGGGAGGGGMPASIATDGGADNDGTRELPAEGYVTKFRDAMVDSPKISADLLQAYHPEGTIASQYKYRQPEGLSFLWILDPTGKEIKALVCTADRRVLGPFYRKPNDPKAAFYKFCFRPFPPEQKITDGCCKMGSFYNHTPMVLPNVLINLLSPYPHHSTPPTHPTVSHSCHKFLMTNFEALYKESKDLDKKLEDEEVEVVEEEVPALAAPIAPHVRALPSPAQAAAPIASAPRVRALPSPAQAAPFAAPIASAPRVRALPSPPAVRAPTHPRGFFNPEEAEDDEEKLEEEEEEQPAPRAAPPSSPGARARAAKSAKAARK